MLLVAWSTSCLCTQVRCGGGYPPPAFPVEELLLDESTFPEGWHAHRDSYDPEDRLPAEQIALGLHINGCGPYSLGAGQYVYRFFDGAEEAATAYRTESALWFSAREGWGPWGTPPELPYESPVADQFRLACCADQTSSQRFCQAVGQYEEYVVLLDVDMNPEYPECMDFNDLERIVAAVDDRMASHLGKNTY